MMEPTKKFILFQVVLLYSTLFPSNHVFSINLAVKFKYYNTHERLLLLAWRTGTE